MALTFAQGLVEVTSSGSDTRPRVLTHEYDLANITLFEFDRSNSNVYRIEFSIKATGGSNVQPSLNLRKDGTTVNSGIYAVYTDIGATTAGNGSSTSVFLGSSTAAHVSFDVTINFGSDSFPNRGYGSYIGNTNAQNYYHGSYYGTTDEVLNANGFALAFGSAPSAATISVTEYLSYV